MRDDQRVAKADIALIVSSALPKGIEAFDLIRQHKPDVVFLDVQMPGLDGFAVLKKLLDKKIPLPQIVFATAYDQYAVEAFERGAVDYVLKPAEPERLQLTVERLKARLASPPTDMSTMLAQLAKQMGLGQQRRRRSK